MRARILFATLALTTGLTLLAQAPPPPEPDAPPPEGPGESAQEGGQRREMMRLMVVSRMRDRLSLSEAQTVKVMTLLEGMEKQQERHREEGRPLMEKLRTLVDNPASTDASFKEVIGALKAQRADQEKQNQAREEELLAVLTLRQQAQWLLLRRELMGRLRDGFEPGHPGAGSDDRPKRQQPRGNH